jgi:DNA topoisomerase-2
MMSSEEQSLSNKYQQKTAKQSILDNPDTFTGSAEMVDSFAWIIDPDVTNRIYEKNINYIPALFKLFDEALVNCRDQSIRMQQALKTDTTVNPVTRIEVIIKEDGTIEMTNDGNGIDVVMHPEYKIWIPELVFSHLNTSTNYDKSEDKIVGGKNGVGIKLVFIWSTYGSVETVDSVRGLKYKQEYFNNLDTIGPPTITKYKSKPYTTITFKPDYKRLGLTNLTPDIIALLKRRVYDIAAVTDKMVKIKYNSVAVPVKNFQQYIDLYIGSKDVAPRVYEESGERWEYAAALSPSHEFIQISFVNGIHTSKGGKHVDYILGQIVRKLCAYIEKKKSVIVNPNSIKEQIILFLRCDIVNPVFDSQTKDFMNTPSAKFGSSVTISDKFIEKLAKMGIMDKACALTELKDIKAAKKTDGVKTKNIRGIPKLLDANLAGTERSSECSIIVCEGDSAKAGIVSGLSSDDRNMYGVYPMKGKIKNTRGEKEVGKKGVENKELADFKKFLGLETGKDYKSTEDVKRCLRYGQIIIMCDQDKDGSHIKGLVINFIHSEWPSLTKIPGFIAYMNTPILKARKGSAELVFYNEGEYETWKTENNSKSWKIKYYKGLGTSTGQEFREIFGGKQKKIVTFKHSGDQSDEAIDMIFNKKRADDRKVFLENYDRNSYLDTNKGEASYEEFIGKELIHFSKYDCERSLGHGMDGLKISLRKILFAVIKKGTLVHSEIKVAQLSGYVSEHSCYHHGEASLNAAIVGMAQNFVGSNNINLLMPNGQFGTRLQGGKDSASERYIFTQLSRITRCIFVEMDDHILEYLDDDGQAVEPRFYAGIVPMVVINGTKGIGTGFSTDIPCYNPLQVIQYLRNKLTNVVTTDDFIPYYEGFLGTIQKIGETKFLIKGLYTKVGPDKIRITELPVGFWTDDFKEHLESLTEAVDKNGKKVVPVVKDYDDLSKDTTIDFIITLSKGKLDELEAIKLDNGCTGLEKQFHLYTTCSTTNMHLFDANDKLKKYTTVSEIIDDYFVTRLHLYQLRKDYQISALTKELVLLSNKYKYIEENLEGTIDLRRKSKDTVTELLFSKKYDIIGEDTDYKYLTKLPMDSVTTENITKLKKEHGEKVIELDVVQKMVIEQTWLHELDTLEHEYSRYREERERATMSVKVIKVKKVVKKISSNI